MVDNVQVSAGTGTAIAADEVVDATLGTVKVQMVKIMDGTLDGTTKMKILAASVAPSATDPAVVVAISPNSVNANGQNTMANSSPVVLPNDFVGTSGFMKKEDVASADGDAGIPSMAVRQAVPADSSSTDGDYEFLRVKDGCLWVREKKSPTGAQTSVVSSASSVTVLASNTSRLGATVFNDSTQVLYLLLVSGGTASTTAYSVQVAASGYYEVPFGYTGDIKGIWASANGNARVTEFA